MVPLSPSRLPTALPQVEDVAWFGADDPSAAGATRRAAVALAARLGFPETRQHEIGVAVTEATTNLVRHSREGRLLLRAVRWPAAEREPVEPVTAPLIQAFGLQIVTIDSGPGMSDVAAAMRDGTSSAGTLGVGLGALARLSDVLNLHSNPGHGTVLVATFLSDGRPGSSDGRPFAGEEPFVTSRVAGLTRPISGETVCGDAYAVRLAGDGVALLLCDGLGHGELAARAANEATRIFREAPDVSQPLEMLGRIHRGISHTRGAAVTVAVLDPAAGVLRMAGVGNVNGVILSESGRSALTGRPGIAGHQARGMAETRHPLPPGSLVILHSDGVSPRFDLSAHPGVTSHGALVVAATVLRDAALRRDDASVLVAATPQHSPRAS